MYDSFCQKRLILFAMKVNTKKFEITNYHILTHQPFSCYVTTSYNKRVYFHVINKKDGSINHHILSLETIIIQNNS